ncbi:MAG: polysaccharide biosynthesis/export family protein [Pyrinomonadaceae bacterium]
MNNSFAKFIRVPIPKLSRSAIVVVLLVTAGASLGQTSDSPRKNNPYSPSPSRKAKLEEPPVNTVSAKSGPSEVAFVRQEQNSRQPDESRSTVAQRTYKIAKIADVGSRPPSDIYKVGVGDVLFVNLKNTVQGSGYFTVRQDGTIDFPLAGENVIVAGQTVETIEEILETGVTLFPDPQIEIKVREYGSHQISVSGLVENAGEKNLQREAIPLFVIRAEAGVSPKATKALVTRAPILQVELYDLRDANTDNILIYPGNSIEFTGEGGSRSSGTEFYFISGEIVSGGQRDLASGLTLYQAVTASGGAKGNPKKAVIRRKNEKGVFSIVEYNFRSIKTGRSADPALAAGDVIEIQN